MFFVSTCYQLIAEFNFENRGRVGVSANNNQEGWVILEGEVGAERGAGWRCLCELKLGTKK